jgi:EAL domain-containing protein (putative c-di-GMP-specific phosphodiesterase class I)
VDGSLPRPLWALPAEPTRGSGVRRWLVVVAAGLLVVVPSALVPSAPLALSLSLSGLAGLAAAPVLLAQSRAAGDARLRWAGVGFAAVPALALLRALLAGAAAGSLGDSVGGASARGGGASAAEPALLLVQALAVPVAVLLGLLATRRGPTALPAAAPLLASPGLRALELLAACVTTATALLWERRAGSGGRHGHGWVTAGLALLALGCAARAVVEERSGPLWWAAVAVGDLGLVVPALGLTLVTGRRSRRQLRRWRVLQERVQEARASSPLLPGRSVSPEEDEGLPPRAAVERRIALGSVGVALQPVVHPATGAVLGAEALARFGGPVTPDKWFRAARREGLGVELELVALRSALAYQPTVPDGGFLAVNLSPLALADDGVLEALRGCDLDRLVVEITEHERVRDYPSARAQLDALRALGARTAVDDTGAGFSSLRHVLLLQPDVIKLDRTLILGIDHDARQRALVEALVSLARRSGCCCWPRASRPPSSCRPSSSCACRRRRATTWGCRCCRSRPTSWPRSRARSRACAAAWGRAASPW